MIGTGRIATLDKRKNFGFITPRFETFAKVFFHHTELQGAEFNALRVGMPVEFEFGRDERGRARALNVRVLGAARA